MQNSLRIHVYNKLILGKLTFKKVGRNDIKIQKQMDKDWNPVISVYSMFTGKCVQFSILWFSLIELFSKGNKVIKPDRDSSNLHFIL